MRVENALIAYRNIKDFLEAINWNADNSECSTPKYLNE